jgi:hypothetical protein
LVETAVFSSPAIFASSPHLTAAACGALLLGRLSLVSCSSAAATAAAAMRRLWNIRDILSGSTPYLISRDFRDSLIVVDLVP